MNLDEYTLCSTNLVKYPNCNATENLFGGQLLAWIDESSAIYASKYMKENLIVTAFMGEVDFMLPAELNKVVSIWAKVLREGRTSLELHVVATKRGAGESEEVPIADTEVVFVSVDENMKPKPWDRMY